MNIAPSFGLRRCARPLKYLGAVIMLFSKDLLSKSAIRRKALLETVKKIFENNRNYSAT